MATSLHLNGELKQFVNPNPNFSSLNPTPFSMATLGLCSASPSLRRNWSVLRNDHPKRRNCRLHVKRGAVAVVRSEVNFVNGDEGKRLVVEEGYAVLDVRDRTQFERAHIKSCYLVPLFVENSDSDLGTIIKRIVHNNFSGLFFGLPFTKPNPDFVPSVKEQFSDDSKLLLVCQEGLRSTAAANKLDEVGFQNISCITSGLQSVKPGTFDSVGSVELQNAGKAGLVTIQGKISALQHLCSSVHNIFSRTSRKAASDEPCRLSFRLFSSSPNLLFGIWFPSWYEWYSILRVTSKGFFISGEV